MFWLISAGLVSTLLLPPGTTRGHEVTVREPAFGLPHFFADTDVELARENGREIAKDRLAQLILLARVGRGTLAQAFGLLDPGTLDDDIETRSTGYTSSELNGMYQNLPAGDRAQVLAYCEGINDTIDAIYAGTLPQPLEVSLIRDVLNLGADLFGNATNVSDQVDPFYRAPGGADPQRPNGGFQFTPEMAMAVAVLEVRNFGLDGFNAASLLDDLQDLIGKHGATAGAEIWDDLFFVNDPLAPVSVPDPTTPGYGGPLSKAKRAPGLRLAKHAARFPRHEYAEAMRRIQARRDARAARASRLGAWPQLGSYSWVIASNRSATGHPWLGGFPQTGIQTPSIMHFAENRSGEGIQGLGMEFAGGAFVLIGQTDSVAYTSTTAQLPIVDTFFEPIVAENVDAIRYDDEGTPAPLSQRTEIFRGLFGGTRIFWRSHERGGNGGSRPIVDFVGDCSGSADGGSATTLTDSDGGFAGCLSAPAYVAITDGTGAGQVRLISGFDDTTLTVSSAWAAPPDATSRYVAASTANGVVAVAIDSPNWLEESTSVLGFGQFQRATSILDVRAGSRLIPTTHNFPAIDNLSFNGIGTASPSGNIGYSSSGFARIRQDATDLRLPLDGSGPNPLVLIAGAVSGATSTTLTATGAVFTQDLSPPAINFRYDNPTTPETEYIVSITGGTGTKQTRRIASNTGNTLTVEHPWGVTPDASSHFEVYEIVAMPEAINPSEGYAANWNNKAATGDPGNGFGRQHRIVFILERLAADATWDRDKQRQLNDDVAGLDGDGAFGRFLIPRLRQAVDAVGNGGVSAVDTALAALEAHAGSPFFGRNFIDPRTDTTTAGENEFLDDLIARLANDIFGDEFSGAVGVPGGSRALATVQHAIDAAAGDVLGAYAQAYAGDYFNGTDWQTVVRDSLLAIAPAGIPDDGTRFIRRYVHPLAGIPALSDDLRFESTLGGNRGTWEQIVEAGPVVKGEFIFPLGQSGHIEGTIAGVTAIDPNADSLQPIWRDWRFLPMLAVSADLESGDGDGDADGVLDGFERWYYGDTSRGATDDSDGDGASLLEEFLAGSDPTDPDSDGDGLDDGADLNAQDGLPALEIAKIRKPNSVALRNASSGGNGSTRTKTLTVVVQLAARSAPRGAVPTTVRLTGERGDAFSFSGILSQDVSVGGGGAQFKFAVPFDVDACDAPPVAGGDPTMGAVAFAATATLDGTARSALFRTSVDVLCKP